MTQVGAFTFLCLRISLRFFAVLPVKITYQDYAGSLSLILHLIPTHIKIVMQCMKTQNFRSFENIENKAKLETINIKEYS